MPLRSQSSLELIAHSNTCQQDFALEGSKPKLSWVCLLLTFATEEVFCHVAADQQLLVPLKQVCASTKVHEVCESLVLVLQRQGLASAKEGELVLKASEQEQGAMAVWSDLQVLTRLSQLNIT